jgi:hypothetical protein
MFFFFNAVYNVKILIILESVHSRVTGALKSITFQNTTDWNDNDILSVYLQFLIQAYISKSRGYYRDHLNFSHRLHKRVSYDSHNKHLLFPYTALNELWHTFIDTRRTLIFMAWYHWDAN